MARDNTTEHAGGPSKIWDANEIYDVNYETFCREIQ
jgi:hypothetical protein